MTFSLGVALLVLLIRPLGMQVGVEPRQRETPAVLSGAPAAWKKTNPAVPKLFVAIIVVTVTAIVLGISNVGLKTYNLVADASGQPKLEAYIENPRAPEGWSAHRIATYDWAKPLFGDSSVWDRYELNATTGGDLHTATPVIADVITTPDLATFSAYGVEACYQFHGYTLADVARVNVGGGITGQAMSYTSQQYGSWSIVYWIIPVKLDGGTSYQRTVLYVQNDSRGVVVPATAKTTGIYNVAGSLSPSDLGSLRNRAFLVAFARQLIGSESRGSGPTPTRVASRSGRTSPPGTRGAIDQVSAHAEFEPGDAGGPSVALGSR